MEQRIQQQTLETILKHHKELLSFVEAPGGVSIDQINMFLHELTLAGAIIEETEDRSSLSELLRYWSSFINDKTGNFPVFQLLPSGFRTQPARQLSNWKFVSLALLIIILVFATTISTLVLTRNSSPPISTPTAQPSSTAVLQYLENHYQRLTVTIDVNGFLGNDSSATNAFSHDILSQTFLQNRRVGFVIVYGGASNDNNLQLALTIAAKAYGDLRQLGNKGPTFATAAYYGPLFILGVPSNLVTIDMYLFANTQVIDYFG